MYLSVCVRGCMCISAKLSAIIMKLRMHGTYICMYSDMLFLHIPYLLHRLNTTAFITLVQKVSVARRLFKFDHYSTFKYDV